MPQLSPRTTPRPPKSAEVAEAKPFLKWVGGKRQLLTQIEPYIPEKYGTYFEPFTGGGALFFRLQPKKAVLADSNERLVRTYLGVRDAVEEVIGHLQSYKHELSSFEAARARDIDRESDAEVAAWMIYLNRTGYNGLYRVNSRNVFNVPFGKYKRPQICSPKILRACSKALTKTRILHADFADTVKTAKKGDFVYFDPPYVPLTKTANFRSYTSQGFEMADQERLRDLARDLKRRGVTVLLSNSSAPEVKELYRDDFELINVQAARAVNRNASGRGKVTELLIR